MNILYTLYILGTALSVLIRCSSEFWEFLDDLPAQAPVVAAAAAAECKTRKASTHHQTGKLVTTCRLRRKRRRRVARVAEDSGSSTTTTTIFRANRPLGEIAEEPEVAAEPSSRDDGFRGSCSPGYRVPRDGVEVGRVHGEPYSVHLGPVSGPASP